MVTTQLPLVYITFLNCHDLLSLPQSVHGATRRTLCKLKGLSEVKVEKIKEAVAKVQVNALNPILLGHC